MPFLHFIVGLTLLQAERFLGYRTHLGRRARHSETTPRHTTSRHIRPQSLSAPRIHSFRTTFRASFARNDGHSVTAPATKSELAFVFLPGHGIRRTGLTMTFPSMAHRMSWQACKKRRRFDGASKAGLLGEEGASGQSTTDLDSIRILCLSCRESPSCG